VNRSPSEPIATVSPVAANVRFTSGEPYTTSTKAVSSPTLTSSCSTPAEMNVESKRRQTCSRSPSLIFTVPSRTVTCSSALCEWRGAVMPTGSMEIPVWIERAPTFLLAMRWFTMPLPREIAGSESNGK
jgi:hypothetical protein